MGAMAEKVYGFYMPTVSLLGLGAVKQVGQQAKVLGGTKALIVTDAGLARIGVADQIKGYLEEAGLSVTVFDGAEPNPTDLNVRDCLKVWQDNGCDLLVTLGGGSSHDCGKGMAIMATSGGDIRDWAGIDTLQADLPPYIAINTTAGTGSEMTRFAVVTNTDTKVKMVFCDARLTADVAVNDPGLMVGLPSSLTAATGMDALTHAVEAYVTTLLSNPVTDCLAMQAIRLIGKWLRKAVANGTDLEARDAMAYAEYLAGMAFNSAGLGIVHSMAHQPGSLLGKPHGVCNAICLPVVCEFNLIANAEKYAKVAELLGENIEGLTTMEAAEQAVAAIRRLSRDIGIPKGLAAIGVTEKDIPVMAENAMKDVCTLFNPRTVKVADIIELYKKAM
ncbi:MULTISPECIES: iron-containing alcohol dehydrogenase [Syntrophotalea]|uniref:L-threonine dehydrogenase n=1 Tax=Syntrophotalea acetylenica TaxID=29542 RepID=A0A1L3GFA5_SYNAC|nr:iron-containing alcohol dehydrogenase [Syntrophotalea acetylenica]APG24519.1 L-threonine dehydrogenase [Syntrophotalea acetylenica]APG45104.1 L-threonine dehydrogenase [Syntrophotalea acetylenica]